MTATKIIFPPLGTAEFVLLGMCDGQESCPAPHHVHGCPQLRVRHDGLCPCRFPVVTELGVSRFGSAWERQHAAFHLTVFPAQRDDARTVRNLREFVVEARKRERGCEYRQRFSARAEGTTMIKKTIFCPEHDWSHTFEVDTAVRSVDDPGREPWEAHVLDGSAPL